MSCQCVHCPKAQWLSLREGSSAGAWAGRRPSRTLPFVSCNASRTFHVTGFHSTGWPSSCSACLALGQKEPWRELGALPGHTTYPVPVTLSENYDT